MGREKMHGMKYITVQLAGYLQYHAVQGAPQNTCTMSHCACRYHYSIDMLMNQEPHKLLQLSFCLY